MTSSIVLISKSQMLVCLVPFSALYKDNKNSLCSSEPNINLNNLSLYRVLILFIVPHPSFVVVYYLYKYMIQHIFIKCNKIIYVF